MAYDAPKAAARMSAADQPMPSMGEWKKISPSCPKAPTIWADAEKKKFSEGYSGRVTLLVLTINNVTGMLCLLTGGVMGGERRWRMVIQGRLTPPDAQSETT